MADTKGEKNVEFGAKAPSKWLNLKNLLIAAIIILCIVFAGLAIWTKKGASRPKQPPPSVFQKMSAPYRHYSAPQRKAISDRVSPPLPHPPSVPKSPPGAAKTGKKASMPAFKPKSSAQKPVTPEPAKYPRMQPPAPQSTVGQEIGGADEERPASPTRNKVKVYDSDSVTEDGIFTEKNGVERPVNRFR